MFLREQKTSWETFFDQIASTYEKQYKEDPFWDLYNEITWRNIKKYLPVNKESIILDAGGGTGFWSRKIAELGYRVICSDISEKMLSEGKKIVAETSLATKIDFVCAEIMNLNFFPPEYFSFVLAEGDVISYCKDPGLAVAELVRVTKKGSRIIASVDSFFGALLRMFKTIEFNDLQLLLDRGNTTYLGLEQHNFTVEELQRLYNDHDLRVLDIIAKPVFATMMPWEKMKPMLSEKETREKILELELQYNNNPDIIGLGNHLEIVGEKL